MTAVAIHLCAPCLAERGDSTTTQVAQALESSGLHAFVAAGPCLGPCERPLALALQGSGATYVFSAVRLPEDLDDLAATCRTYLDSPGGWIGDARRCGRLRYCLVTRIPAAGDAEAH